MPLLEDKIYIQQVLDGKTSSFTHLVDKYKNMVFTICYRILRHTEDAEDAAQESFIKAFHNLDTFQGDSKLSTWLYTIAFRTSVSKTKLSKLETVSDAFFIDSNADFKLPQIEELKIQEQEFYVKKAISSLPELDSIVISLFYMDECSILEIVKITGMSESNVKVKLHRARKQLKLELESMLKEEMKSII